MISLFPLTLLQNKGTKSLSNKCSIPGGQILHNTSKNGNRTICDPVFVQQHLPPSHPPVAQQPSKQTPLKNTVVLSLLFNSSNTLSRSRQQAFLISNSRSSCWWSALATGPRKKECGFPARFDFVPSAAGSQSDRRWRQSDQQSCQIHTFSPVRTEPFSENHTH